MVAMPYGAELKLDDNYRPKDALIYSEKLCLPKEKPRKIKTLDSCLRGNDDFFSASLTVIVQLCATP